MSREVSNSNSQTIQSLDDLLLIFRNGGRSPNEFKIGMEVERFLVDQKTQKAMPFDGEKGVERFLTEVANLSPRWEKILDQGKLISLKCGDIAITLEPGGQVEMSCGAHKCISEMAKEIEKLDSMLQTAAEKIGGKIIARGVHPIETIDSNPWMPKSRYRWMREYYEKRGKSAFEMMLLSASIQVNYDYVDEEDAKKKVFVSSFLGPIMAAVFANSSIEQGKPNGYQTRRIPIWLKTDPDRCGTPDFFVDGTFSFEKYRDYALDIPMYFAFRDGKYVDVKNVTFRKFVQSGGGEWGPVTLGDWDFHLTTLFPDVRLKNHLEFRTVDSNSMDLVIGLAAFWKGLLHNPSTVDKWNVFFKKYAKKDLNACALDVSKKALSATFGDHTVLQLAKNLLEDATNHLRNSGNIETRYLNPVREILETGMTPAQRLIDANKAKT